MIGIISHVDDLHTTTVRDQLVSMGAEVALIDTAALPSTLALTTWQDNAAGWSGEWGIDGIDLHDLRVMWWRRPQPFGLHAEVTHLQDRGFAAGECAAAVAGMWSCLDATWVNDPDRDEAASRKMWQLKLAAELGWRVPRTCMTSSPERARAFLATEPGAVVFKPFSGTPDTWRETRPVRPADVELLDHVRFAPVIFQEAIPGGCDVRVTVVGEQIFPARIQAPATAYEYDFRIIDGQCETTPCLLPDQVVAKVRALMQRLGLWYGAIDLRRAPDGEHVFLEVNPAGQWLFVEYATGQPISRAVAGLLARLDDEATSRAA